MYSPLEDLCLNITNLINLCETFSFNSIMSKTYLLYNFIGIAFNTCMCILCACVQNFKTNIPITFVRTLYAMQKFHIHVLGPSVLQLNYFKYQHSTHSGRRVHDCGLESTANRTMMAVLFPRSAFAMIPPDHLLALTNRIRLRMMMMMMLH